ERDVAARGDRGAERSAEAVRGGGGGAGTNARPARGGGDAGQRAAGGVPAPGGAYRAGRGVRGAEGISLRRRAVHGLVPPPGAVDAGTADGARRWSDGARGGPCGGPRAGAGHAPAAVAGR